MPKLNIQFFIIAVPAAFADGLSPRLLYTCFQRWIDRLTSPVDHCFRAVPKKLEKLFTYRRNY